MIDFAYKCHGCGVIGRSRVRVRNANEDICHWIEMVAEIAGDHHGIMSMLCNERKVDLLVPVLKDPKSQGIGYVNHSLPEDLPAAFAKKGTPL